jgi:peroxiredoxin
MEPLSAGSPAPAIPGVDFASGPQVVFFYKVTCPVCQMAAPQVQRFQEAYPGRIVGVGEDAPEDLDTFARRFGLSFGSVPDESPYELSNAYGIRTVPTTFLVGADGVIARTVESWDRDGLNELSPFRPG